MNYSLYAPGLDPAFIDKAVRHLQEASEYLDDSTTSKLRILTEANLKQMVRKREGQFDVETVRQELNRHVGVVFAKDRQCFEPVVFPASPAEIPDDTDGPYLAVLHWEGHTVEQDHVHLPELVVRLFKERGDSANTRRNRNNLVFVCADRLQVDDMLRKTRTFLALEQMQRGDLFVSLQTHQQEQVKERHGRARQAFALAVQQAYRHVFYPERGPWPETPLVHSAITVPNASSEPGVGQKQVATALRREALTSKAHRRRPSSCAASSRDNGGGVARSPSTSSTNSPTTHPSYGVIRVRTGSDASPGQVWAPGWPPLAWS